MDARFAISLPLVCLGLLGCGRLSDSYNASTSRSAAKQIHQTAKAMVDMRVRAFMGGGSTRAQGLGSRLSRDQILFSPTIPVMGLTGMTTSSVPCYTTQGDVSDADSDFIMSDAAITYNNCKTTSSDGRTVIFSGVLRQRDGSDTDYTSGFAFNRENFTVSYLGDGFTETVTIDQRAIISKTHSGYYDLTYAEGQNNNSTDIAFGGQLASDVPQFPFASGIVNVTGGVSTGSAARIELSLETKNLHADNTQISGILNGGAIILRDGQNTMSSTYNSDGSSIDLYNGAPY